MKRVKHVTIIPINGVSYDRVGKIDPRRTRIRTSDLADLAAERGERPRYLRHLLREIPKRLPTQTELKKPKRGPMRGATGFQDKDRELFEPISELIKSGKARSANSAALKLADRIPGGGSDQNRATRVARRYIKERNSR
jgi:hypothetical protein